MQAEQLPLIQHEVEQALIQQRAVDGYGHVPSRGEATTQLLANRPNTGLSEGVVCRYSYTSNGPGAGDSRGNTGVA